MGKEIFKIIRVNSWDQAWLLGRELARWCFRGQSDYKWSLKHSLERSLSDRIKRVNDILINREKLVVYQFKRRAHHYRDQLPLDENMLEWLSLMQHHGAPTRLLDATHSFPVAAFFSMENATTDAAIWAFDLEMLEKIILKRTGGDKVQRMLHERNKQNIKLVEDFIRGEASGRLIIPVEPERMNERLSIQQGLFLFPGDLSTSFEQNLADTFQIDVLMLSDKKADRFPYKKNIEKVFETVGLLKIILPAKIHAEAMWDLWRMNVNAATLFPGLDGFARSLNFWMK